MAALSRISVRPGVTSMEKRGSFGCGSVQAGRFALAAKCGSVLLGLQSRSCSNVGRILE